MLNDDQNRDSVTSTDPTRRNTSSGMMWGLIAAVAVFALLFMWAPWSGPRVADNTTPGSTVGSSTTRPTAPAAPTTREPAIPAAPSTTR